MKFRLVVRSLLPFGLMLTLLLISTAFPASGQVFDRAFRAGLGPHSGSDRSSFESFVARHTTLLPVVVQEACGAACDGVGDQNERDHDESTLSPFDEFSEESESENPSNPLSEP